MPLFMSTTKNIKSIICAPPIIVRINEAWPGQSTNVNWKNFYLTFVYSYSGTLVINDEKPRSKVIPRYFDWGLLSKLAVDAIWVSTRHIEVLPESTWPKTPTLIFIQSFGFIIAIYYLDISKSYFYIWLTISIIIYNII